MYTILVSENNELITTVRERIMQRSKLVDNLHFLMEPTYKGLDMTKFTASLEFITPIGRELKTEILFQSPELYKDQIEFKLPIDTIITREAGDVELQLSFVYVEMDADGHVTQHVRKTSPTTLTIIPVANWSTVIGDDAMIVATSGRYEFRNKGIDVFIEAMNRLNRDERLKKNVLAFVEVPAWVGEPREDLRNRINSGDVFDTPLDCPMITHWLHNMSHDNVLDMMKYHDMWNRKDDKVKLIFIPCYLNGDDGIMNMPYYDVIIGKDLSVYPSYYEPWGYTPLESVAFKVPCITTDLAGFGLWANSLKGAYSEISDGVKTIHRTDYNYSEVADVIKDTVSEYSSFSETQVKRARAAADKLSKKALWSEFIKYYWQAYDFALKNK